MNNKSLENLANFIADEESTLDPRELQQLKEAKSIKNYDDAEKIGPFIKTPVVINAGADIKGTTIKELLKVFEKTAKEKGFSDVHPDLNIIKWFPREKVIETNLSPSRLLNFDRILSYDDIIRRCKFSDCYQQLNLSDAIKRAIGLINSSEFNQKSNYGVIVYLETLKGSCPCTLNIWYYHKVKMLDLYVRKVDLDYKWPVGTGVLVDNESLES